MYIKFSLVGQVHQAFFYTGHKNWYLNFRPVYTMIIGTEPFRMEFDLTLGTGWGQGG